MVFSPQFLRTLRTVVTLLSWYFISSVIILLTKWLFVNFFAFPLIVTTYSNSLATVWAFLMSRRQCWRPEPLTRKQFRDYVLPIGISTALEIGFSNIALKILTVSFGTILKGGSPVFTMFWGLLLRTEVFKGNVCLTLITIALGIALASFGEGHEFVMNGFILQLLGVALGGLRWAMTQVLLRGSEDGAMPPLTAILYTSTATAACVLPFALFLEGGEVLARLQELDAHQVWIISGTMTIVASLVFVLLISEYWLVNATSSLGLSVAGVFKELLTIAGGIIIFSDHISVLNIVGFVICQIGIIAYAYIRYERKDTEDKPSDGIPEHQVPLRSSVDEDDTDEDEMQSVDGQVLLQTVKVAS